MHFLMAVYQFAERWLGSLSQVLLVFLGILVSLIIIVGLWDRRIRPLGACVGITIGLSLIFYSHIVSAFAHFEVHQRVALLALFLGGTLCLITFWSVYVSILHLRYALFWFGMSMCLIISGAFPWAIGYLSKETAGQYYALIGVGCIGFLTLMLFYFSLILTRLERKYEQLLLQQRAGENNLNPLPSQPAGGESRRWFSPIKKFLVLTRKKTATVLDGEVSGRSIRGTRIGAPVIIALACLSVLAVGFASPQAMIGDEVTHYYMLVNQAHDLSRPNFFAEIPQSTGKMETRRYPHAFLWHYFGALVYRLTGSSFFAIQIYQTFFLFQLLLVAYLLARSRGGVNTRAALIYLLTLASLPLCLIFSVAFYQDVPVTAQVLTAFYLLRRKRWYLASCFMALAVGFKETAVLFFPAFFMLFLWWRFRQSGIMKSVLTFIFSAFLILGCSFGLGKTVNMYAHAPFYPLQKLEHILAAVKRGIGADVPGTGVEPAGAPVHPAVVSTANEADEEISETAPQIIANNPGDLRIKENFFVYGGILLWLVVFLGALLNLPLPAKYLGKTNLINKEIILPSGRWLYLTGGSFLVLAAYFGRTAPDARFFLPGLPFVLLPFAEGITKLKKTKVLITLLATLAILQGGYVLAKTYRLRVVSPAIKAGIAYLVKHPPVPPGIFMYPEGDYRLFPMQHEWYLGYRLREFWRADDGKRIEMLRQFHVGAVVIKKHLIAPVDKAITNLGVYPPEFVHDLKNDPRFTRVFENKDLLIFQLSANSEPNTK